MNQTPHKTITLLNIFLLDVNFDKLTKFSEDKKLIAISSIKYSKNKLIDQILLVNNMCVKNIKNM